MKAIGTGLTQNVTFKDIEVLNQDSGAPYVVTYGAKNSGPAGCHQRAC